MIPAYRSKTGSTFDDVIVRGKPLSWEKGTCCSVPIVYVSMGEIDGIDIVESLWRPPEDFLAWRLKFVRTSYATCIFFFLATCTCMRTRWSLGGRPWSWLRDERRGRPRLWLRLGHLRLRDSDSRGIYLNKIAERVNCYLSSSVPVGRGWEGENQDILKLKKKKSGKLSVLKLKTNNERERELEICKVHA